MTKYWDRKLLPACLAAVLALGLAGCGSSGSNNQAGDDGTMEPSPVSLAGVPNHGLTAQTLTIEAGATATVGNVTFSCPSGGADCAVAITVADGTASVTSDGGMATAAYSAAYKQQVADAANEASARALGLQAKIAGTQAADAVFNPTVTVTRGVGADAKIKVTDSVDTTAFKAGTAPAAITGWSGAGFMRGAATEYVTVYSNIAAPTATKFTADNVDTLTGRSTGSGAYDGSKLTLAATNDGKFIASDKLPVPTVGTTTLTFTTAKDKKFTGTFAGATGTYECTDSSDCTAQVSHTGSVTALTGSAWQFTPDEGAKFNQPDTDHLHFGWWMDSPDKAGSDGKYVYDFRTFYGGSTTAFTTDQITVLEGEAKYSGKAAGVYVTRSFDDARKATGGTAGEFTADVTLNAAFGGDDVAASKKHKISGEITNFMEGGKSLGWSVSLDESTIPDSGSEASVVSGTTRGYHRTGAPAGSTGTWTGMFYGEDRAALPSGVAGKFDASIGATDLAGAFGAEKR